MAAATSISTGRTIMPTTPVAAAATTTGSHDVTEKPGSSAAVRSRARKLSEPRDEQPNHVGAPNGSCGHCHG